MTDKKQHFLSRWKERGNIFFTLFAAVGVVGAIGVGSTTLLKGPVQTMVKINQKQVTEEYSELGLRVMMANVLNNDANCDGDNKLEAAEWDDPTPPFTAPTGGGVFPSAYGTKVTDPWGRRLGYCVWDHDVIDHAGCGGGTQKRLRGVPNTIDQSVTDMDEEPFITVISAGPNQVFETSCNDFIDLNTDDEPDTPLLIKPTNSDDLIVNYSTIDAQQAMGDNWVFSSNETADGDAATTDQNLDFAQDVTFSGLLDLNKLGGGLTLPDFSGATCDGTTEGQLFRDSATTPPAVMVCDSGTFKAMSGSGGGDTGSYAYNFDPEAANCTLSNDGPFTEITNYEAVSNASNQGLWSHDGYIFTGEGGSSAGVIRALSFNGTNFTEHDSIATPKQVFDFAYDGEYYYAAIHDAGVYAYTFDGSSFTEVGSYDPTGAVFSTFTQNGYIYITVSGTEDSIRALTFNGTSFTLIDKAVTTGSTPYSIWADENYIYLADFNLKAFTFDGTTLTQVGSIATAGSTVNLFGDSDYIYAAERTGGLSAYTFNGTTFTQEGNYNTGQIEAVWASGTQIFTAGVSGGLGVKAYNFDGSSFTESNVISSNSGRAVWGDGTYLYMTTANDGIVAYSGFECLSTTPDLSERPDAPNTGVDYNYRSYGWGHDVYGELGNGAATSGDQVSPTLVLENNGFFQVSTRADQSCGLKADGSAWCWGEDNRGQLGNGDAITSNQETPYPVSGDHKFIKINVGYNNVCALKENGTMWCWGGDNSEQMGNGPGVVPESDPRQITELSNIIDIAVKSTSPCALESNGTAWCWGDDAVGELGNGTETAQQSSPVKVDTKIKFIQISTSPSNGCGLTETGSIWCWGANGQGQIGNGSIGPTAHSPQKVTGINDFIKVNVGSNHVCGLRESGELWCWGDDNNGQLGNGASLTADQPLPTKVVGIADFIDVSAAATATCAVRSNGTTWCWGADTNGQLGNGAGITGDQDSPTQVENLTNVVDISCMSGVCIAATIEPKQAPETAPTTPVIIEQKTTAGNTSGSHGLAINFNSTTDGGRVGLAFKIDAEDTAAGDDVSTAIKSRYDTTTPTLRFDVHDGTAMRTSLRIRDTGSVSLSRLGGTNSPKFTINNGLGSTWNDSRFDTGLLVRDSVIDKPAFYGVDSTTGNAVILSGEDLLIQHATTDGVTVTPIVSFVNTGVPEFYGDILMSGNNRKATISAYTDTADETAAFKFLRYRGTAGAEAAVSDEDFLGEISFTGFDGTDYDANGNIRMYSMASNPPIVGNVSTRLRIAREDGTDTGDQLLKISAGGNIIIGEEHIASGRLKIYGRTTADNAVKANNDTSCGIAEDEGTLRFTGTEYEYCKDDGGGGYFWESVVADPTCEDEAIFVDMSVSGTGSCATLSNGQSVCWGDNSFNQLGNGSSNDPEVDLRPMNTHKATQTVTGFTSSCMLTDGQRIKCVGRNHVRQLGNYTNSDSDVPLYIASNNQYTKLTSGYGHRCAIRTDRKVDCWGWNTEGQAGDGTTSNVLIPTEVPNLSNVIDITAGVYHSCALLSDRTVQCWGGNLEGQLGLGTETTRELIPTSVAITDVIKISAGGGGTESGTCALKTDGTIWCWGDNFFGQIGNGTSGAANVTTPTQVSGITNAIDVVRHRRSAIALLDDGTLKYWGRYESYGIPTSPTVVAGVSNVVKIADGPHALHACAILTDGSAKCWGYGLTGQLGDGNTANSGTTTVDVINPLSCAADKYVFATSDNYKGNLGGLKGADNICQAHADRAGLPGRYQAWLSDDTGSPSTRFNRALTDYKLVNGTVVANGWFDLTDGTLDNAINTDENGNLSGGGWTNTLIDGSIEDTVNDCKNWSTVSGANGNLGNGSATGSAWTDNLSTPCHSSTQSLYCFQQ